VHRDCAGRNVDTCVSAQAARNGSPVRYNLARK